MRREDYDRFTDELARSARDDERIAGLVVLGSTAAVGREPDEWSDHDFFVIANPGTGDDLRADRTWLPSPERIVVHFRETELGRSAIYDDGHLAEFAVFEGDELDVAKANDHRVLVDDGTIAGRMAALAERTAAEVERTDPDGSDRFGSFSAQLVIGMTRYGRGERLSANHLVRGWAVRSMLSVLATVVEPDGPPVTDGLDPHRRFEVAYPGLAAEIGDALGGPLPSLATVLLDVAERELAPRVPAATEAALATLRSVVARSTASA